MMELGNYCFYIYIKQPKNKQMKRIFLSAFLLVSLSLSAQNIDRKQVVERNNPHVVTMDSLNSLSVGNGGFAMTVDGTGLQSFPKSYSKGVPLGTMSDWGWHSFANPENYKPEESWRYYDYGRGRKEHTLPRLRKIRERRLQEIGIVSILIVCIWVHWDFLWGLILRIYSRLTKFWTCGME